MDYNFDDEKTVDVPTLPILKQKSIKQSKLEEDKIVSIYYNFDEEKTLEKIVKKKIKEEEAHYHQYVGMNRIQDGTDFTSGTGNVMMVGTDQFGNKVFYQGTVTTGATIETKTTAQRLVLTATDGETVFDTDLLSLYTYYGGTWYTPSGSGKYRATLNLIAGNNTITHSLGSTSLSFEARTSEGDIIDIARVSETPNTIIVNVLSAILGVIVTIG